jgi:hypothetical protein
MLFHGKWPHVTFCDTLPKSASISLILVALLLPSFPFSSLGPVAVILTIYILCTPSLLAFGAKMAAKGKNGERIIKREMERSG